MSNRIKRVERAGVRLRHDSGSPCGAECGFWYTAGIFYPIETALKAFFSIPDGIPVTELYE